MTTADPIPTITPETEKHWRTRAAFRDELLEALDGRLADVSAVIDSGPLEGVHVITRADWQMVLHEAGKVPLLPVSDHAAEVITHASVTVWAVCPRCRVAGPILVTIEPELRVDDAGGELRVKAKAKARTHVCGQLTIPVGPEVEGQASLDLEDIVGDRCDVIVRYDAEAEQDVFCRLPAGHDGDHDELGHDLPEVPCLWPGCVLAAEHSGAHVTAVDDLPDEPTEEGGQEA